MLGMMEKSERLIWTPVLDAIIYGGRAIKKGTLRGKLHFTTAVRWIGGLSLCSTDAPPSPPEFLIPSMVNSAALHPCSGGSGLRPDRLRAWMKFFALEREVSLSPKTIMRYTLPRDQ